MDADEVQLSREAQDLNFNNPTSCLRAVKALTRLRLHIYFHTLYASSEGSAETAHCTGLSGPCLLAYAININLVSIAGAG